MRQIFKLVMIAVLLLGIGNTYAQSVYKKGSFSLSSNPVNYRLLPATITDSVNVQLNVVNPTTKFAGSDTYLGMEILNSSNSSLMSWNPTANKNFYFHHFDISSLSAGTYHINIKSSTGSVLQTITFTK